MNGDEALKNKNLPTLVGESVKDPFLEENKQNTVDLIRYLLANGVKVATLSKMGTSRISGVRHGMTVVSLDDSFHNEFEPNTRYVDHRILVLYTRKKELGDFVWVSMEPYPPSAIHKQSFDALLKFVGGN